MKEKRKQFSNVFTYATIVVGLLVLLGSVFPDQFGETSGAIGNWITETFGWYYMTIFTLILFFCIFLGLSPIGKLKLGKPNDTPEFKTISWLTMLFSAGMGIGLVFYGSSEPISHYLAPPTAEPETKAALAEAMRSTFMHYGFHPWAVYGIVALSLAYSQFRKDEVGLISKTLRPILGDKVDGPIGNIVDVLSVFATIIGVAVSLGVGAMQINGGLNYLFGIPNNQLVQGMIIAIVTVLFLFSAWTGLSKGIQYLSNLNMILAGLLFTAVLILGPTLLILNMATSGTGDYLNTLLYNTFDVAPLNEQKHEWMQTWTIYYWGWWMSWSPFVGIFIARISRGRSIREFVFAILLVPTFVSILWFSAFGLTGVEVGQNVPQIFEMSPETQLFGIFNELPISIILSAITLLLISSFFITSADSATFVLGMQTAFGTLSPANFVKIVWGLALSAIAFVLLLAGGETGLNALQSAAIISALPFSVVVLMMTIAFYKDANRERKYLGLTITPDKKRMKEYMEKNK
ncbi:BCCT family transporter [Oceanobacillus halophilus]|uniref:BCCT family transporter n=1 Tax=Oceanobacillus halophilus TaxID=930130 RepID=A0A494ZVE2_9BACI|nr:BCCT family transporter [Oceanobacillus halophilus]RKQ30419.1 BCCT family transporter [Oceanobacillus halophilus]